MSHETNQAELDRLQGVIADQALTIAAQADTLGIQRAQLAWFDRRDSVMHQAMIGGHTARGVRDAMTAWEEEHPMPAAAASERETL